MIKTAAAPGIAALLSAVLLLAGCMFGGSTDTRATLAADKIPSIERGRTTKTQILDWFGPPAAIVRPSDAGRIVPGSRIGAETWLELFSARGPLHDDDLVYYYGGVAVESSGGVVALIYHESRRVRRQNLWVLIDNRTGIVRDYVARSDAD